MGAGEKVDITATSSDISILREHGFNLESKIGEGSYAKVYKATYNTMTMACKLIDTSQAHYDYTNKFLPRELDLLIQINHPNIIKTIGILQRRAKYFLFLRYADRGDLLDFIALNGALAEGQARLWFRQIISGLQYIHAANAAHRDLKCENILITANYNVKLTDFGFARIVKYRGRDVLSETFCGSLSYASPEILKGVPYLPQPSDIWSLGVILYTMLNKALPFNETSIKKLYEKQMTRKWRFRTNIVSEVSAESKQLVASLMEPDPTLRPTCTHILAGQWLSMDPRISKLTSLELSLLKSAQDIERKGSFDSEAERLAELRRKGRVKEGLKVLKEIDTTNFQSQTLFSDSN